MSLDIARARTALARELASLEEYLASDADWQALRAFEVQTGHRMPPQLDRGAALALPENLREALNKNPIVLARARLYEALEFLLAPELEPPLDFTPPSAAYGDEMSHQSLATIGGPRAAQSDDLTLIDGITTAIAADLKELDVTAFDDIAGWSADDVSLFASLLDLPDEIFQQNWPQQAAAFLIMRRRNPEINFAADNDRQPLETVSPAVDAAQRIDAALGRLVERARVLPAAIRNAPAGTELPAMLPELLPPVLAAPASIASTFMAVFDEERDDLRHIAFIDEQVAAQLNASGILRFSDIAHFTVDQVAILSVRFGLGNRITREQWIEQAAVLAAGRSTAYASRIRSGEPTALEQSLLQEAYMPRPGPVSVATSVPVSEHRQPGFDKPFYEPLPGSTPLSVPPVIDPPPLNFEPDPGYADFDFASLDRSGASLAATPPMPPAEEAAAVSPSAPWMIEADQPIVPPPLPPSYADLASLLTQEEHDIGFNPDVVPDVADDSDNDSHVWIVPSFKQTPQAQDQPALTRTDGAKPARAGSRHRPYDDRPLLRNPLDWEPIEEAAVEIVPRSPPFPGVGPVSEAVSRLQSAVEPPAPAIARLLRAFQRR